VLRDEIRLDGYDRTISDIVFDPDLGRASYVVRVSAESLSIRALPRTRWRQSRSGVAPRSSGREKRPLSAGGCGLSSLRSARRIRMAAASSTPTY
jgi:hypothetical protein